MKERGCDRRSSPSTGTATAAAEGVGGPGGLRSEIVHVWLHDGEVLGLEVGRPLDHLLVVDVLDDVLDLVRLVAQLPEDPRQKILGVNSRLLLAVINKLGLIPDPEAATG